MFLLSALQFDNDHVPSEGSCGIRNKEWTGRRKWESEKARMGWLVNMGIPKSISLFQAVSVLGSRIDLWVSRAQASGSDLSWALSGHCC